MIIELYRYNPETDKNPYIQQVNYEEPKDKELMVLDVLEALKIIDPTLSYRRSCREGVCGSDGLNMNGRNGLACITLLSEIAPKGKLTIRPLPGLPVIRDLVVDMNQFWKQYEKVRPYLINNNSVPTQERLQSPEDRAKLDGLYECILCACCTTTCPSWWWNPEKYIGPAGLLQANRDTATKERLEDLKDPFSIFRCRGVANCNAYCPKGLLPLKAISDIKLKMISKES